MDNKEQMRAYMASARRNRLINIQELNQFVVKGQIDFVGSSLCEYFPINELLNGESKRYLVYNRGIAGDTTSQLMENLEECIFALEPSKIFINIGTNDMNTSEYDENHLLENYRKILMQIKIRLPKAKIYVQSYYPVNPDVKTADESLTGKEIYKTRNNQAIISANQKVQELAAEQGCEYIDLYPLLLDTAGKLDEKYTVQGIHLKPKAYQMILKKLLPYLE